MNYVSAIFQRIQLIQIYYFFYAYLYEAANPRVIISL